MANLDTDFDLHEMDNERDCWCCPEKDGDYWWHNVFGMDTKRFR